MLEVNLPNQDGSYDEVEIIASDSHDLREIDYEEPGDKSELTKTLKDTGRKKK
jgi:hypothetical protein